MIQLALETTSWVLNYMNLKVQQILLSMLGCQDVIKYEPGIQVIAI